MSEFPVFATYFTSSYLHQRWRKGDLVCEWAFNYPLIFDDDDLRIALNQLEYHYHEWLSAILLYHTKGLLSLYAKYTFRRHERKLGVIERLCDAASVEFLLSRGQEARPQGPDLLVYRPDLSDWFFCEVKGPNDKIRQKQVKVFDEVEQATGKKVYIVKLLEIEKPRKAS